MFLWFFWLRFFSFLPPDERAAPGRWDRGQGTHRNCFLIKREWLGQGVGGGTTNDRRFKYAGK